jgi:hypothetical protein
MYIEKIYVYRSKIYVYRSKILMYIGREYVHKYKIYIYIYIYGTRYVYIGCKNTCVYGKYAYRD